MTSSGPSFAVFLSSNSGKGCHFFLPPSPSNFRPSFRKAFLKIYFTDFRYATTRALVIALICTFVGILNIPVFWPILLIYFIVLFMITMKKQIIHMWTHKYLPFTFGKPKFKGEKAKEEEK